MDAERIIGREVLRKAVGDQVTCPKSHKVLDVRSAVLAQIKWRSGNVADVVVDASVWPNLETQLPDLRRLSLVEEVNVYDGRTLFA